MDTKFTNNQEEKRNIVLILREEMIRKSKSKHKGPMAFIFNSSFLLLILLGIVGGISAYSVAQLTHSIAWAVTIVVLSVLGIVSLALKDLPEKYSTIVFAAAFCFFTIHVIQTAPSLSSIVPWLFLYIVLSFFSYGGLNAIFWIGIQEIFVIIAIWRDQHLANPSMSAFQIKFFLSSQIFMVLAIYFLDYTSRLMILRSHEQSKTIEEANARYDTILNSVGDGLIATDEQGIVEFINHEALKLLGVSRNDIIGQPFNACVLAKSEEGHVIPNKDRLVTRVLATGEPIVLNQTSKEHQYLVRADESSFPASMAVTPVKVMDQIRGVIVLFHDMTDEDAMDRAKSEFVSLASHQLRTPLNVISWYVEKLQSEKRGKLNTRQSEYLKEVYTNNKRMIGLVGDLLNVSRIELGRVKLKTETVDLLQLIDQLVKEIEPLIEQKKLRFKKDIQLEKAILLNSDTSVVTVIVQNLLSNAVKYTPADGSVTIQLTGVSAGQVMESIHNISATQVGCLIKVTDSGIGIPQAQQDKIFTKLFRAENVQTLDVSGTGLGLYVTQSFAEALGGRIWFDSTEGSGTSFYVYLPFERPQQVTDLAE